MDIQTFLDNSIKAARAETMKTSDQLTLGELVLKLKEIPLRSGKDEQTIQFDFEYAFPAGLSSWRGSYSELALEFAFEGNGLGDSETRKPFKISEFIELLEGAIGKTYTGWKGGDFTMGKTTPIWVANDGNAGNTAVIGVKDNGYSVILLTGYREY